MAKVILNGPLSYRYKGRTYKRGVVSPEIPEAEAKYLVGTGRFLYEGQKDPKTEGEKANKAARTHKMSDLVKTDAVKKNEFTDKAPAKDTGVKTDKKPGKKTKGKIVKRAAVDKGLPVFGSVEEVVMYAQDKYGVEIDADDQDTALEMLKQIKVDFEAEEKVARASGVEV